MSELDRLIQEPARLVIIARLSKLQKADFLYLTRSNDCHGCTCCARAGLPRATFLPTWQDWRRVGLTAQGN